MPVDRVEIVAKAIYDHDIDPDQHPGEPEREQWPSPIPEVAAAYRSRARAVLDALEES